MVFQLFERKTLFEIVSAVDLFSYCHIFLLRFSLTLRRRAGFRAYLLTVPCVVLGAMSILVFALPAERPDRHSLG